MGDVAVSVKWWRAPRQATRVWRVQVEGHPRAGGEWTKAVRPCSGGVRRPFAAAGGASKFVPSLWLASMVVAGAVAAGSAMAAPPPHVGGNAGPAAAQARSPEDEEERLQSDPYLQLEVSRLLDEVDSADPDVRGRAAARLGRLKVSRAVRPLTALLLADRSSGVRVAAAEALGGIGSPLAVDALNEVLFTAGAEATDEYVREAAATALGRIGDSRAVAALQRAVARGRASAQARQALEDLVARSPQARSVVAGLNRQLAARAVAQLGDTDAAVRAAACSQLAEYPSPAGVLALLPLLKDPDKEVRCLAAEALGAAKDPRATGPLGELLEDPNAEVRRAAATALGRLGDRSAAPALIRRLSDRNKQVRLDAAQSLGILRDAAAVAPLVARMRDPAEDGGVRSSACAAVGAIGGAEAAEALAEVLAGGGVADMRLRAALAMGRTGDRRAFDALAAAARTRRNAAGDRIAAVEVLAALGEGRAEAVLTSLSRDPDAQVKEAVLAGLKAMRVKRPSRPRNDAGTATQTAAATRGAPTSQPHAAAKDESKARFYVSSAEALITAGKYAEAFRYAAAASDLAEEPTTARQAGELAARAEAADPTLSEKPLSVPGPKTGR